jgi:hypothetical protein
MICLTLVYGTASVFFKTSFFRIAVVEAFILRTGYAVVGIYQRRTPDYYPFYANFLQQMTAYDNGVIGTDFEIYSTWQDFYDDTNAWRDCNFSYSGLFSFSQSQPFIIALILESPINSQ